MWIVAIALVCSGVILPLILNNTKKNNEISKPIKEESEKKINKQKIIYLIAGIVVILISLVFIIAFINSLMFSKNSLETTATITNITRKREGTSKSEKHWETWVYVEYEIENIKYEKNLHEYNKDMYEGKNIKIYYDKENPEKIKISNSPAYSYIVISLVILFIGMNFIIESKK